MIKSSKFFLTLMLLAASSLGPAVLTSSEALATSYSATNGRDDASSDLVVPRPDDGTEQDAIVKDKQNQMDATEDDAQNRKIPEKTTNYTRIVPFYDGDEPPKLTKKLKNGTRQYDQKPIPQKYSGGFSVGPYNPTNLVGDTPGITYQNIYGTNPALMVDLNAEYQFFKSFGKLGIKGDVNIITAKGLGRFVHNYNPNIGQVSDLTLTLIGLPVIASLAYHLQFWDKQAVVPFAEAGVGYFGLFETRGDKSSIADAVKYGGSPIGEAVGGVQFMLDGLDKQVMWELRQSYGISHIYLKVDARQIFQLGGFYDFASTVFEGGFLFEF